MRLKLIIFAISFVLISPFFLNQAVAYDFMDDSGLKKTAAGTGHGELPMNDVNLARTIGNFIAIALSFLGVLFLLLMVYAGFTWMTSRGNEQQTEKAKSIIINSVIGLAIVLLAYVITSIVISNTQSTGNPAEDAANNSFNNCQPADGCIWQDGGPSYPDMGGT